LDAEDEWVIVRINKEKCKRGGDEHKVRWRSRWVLGSELENAQRLAQEYDARSRAQRRCKRGNRYVQITAVIGDLLLCLQKKYPCPWFY